MTKREIIKVAFIRSLPVMCSYLFLSIAYGMLMEESGFGWYYSLPISMIVYTGAFQFVLITFLKNGGSLITVALTAILMNSRQSFYSLTFLKDFKKMGKKKLYMIHTLTDETYAVNCSLDLPEKEKEEIMFLIALFSHVSWMAGTVAGGLLGQMIPFDLTGIDFCMTALFVIIFMDQWGKTREHVPALSGLCAGVCCLILFGADRFMLPALLAVSGVLLVTGRKEVRS